ncbi:MAG: NrdH-redoxin [Anaerolineae bacterium]|nr:MAG: NrdH-redoxin [Anaerolineae bacterium]
MENIIHMYGADWCPDCRRAKRFFQDYGIEYIWHDTDSDPEAAAFVREANNGRRVIPTIVFPDGSMLVEPSNAELAAKTGVEL